MNKKSSRIRRARKFRYIAKRDNVVRLCAFRSARHIYAQIIGYEANGTKVLASASSLEADVKAKKSGDKSDVAKLVGKTVAERAKKAGITKVSFDRSGFRYHGRVKALAEGAREGGLEF